jgi:predicted nuclease with TOPRIM domain
MPLEVYSMTIKKLPISILLLVLLITTSTQIANADTQFVIDPSCYEKEKEKKDTKKGIERIKNDCTEANCGRELYEKCRIPDEDGVVEIEDNTDKIEQLEKEVGKLETEILLGRKYELRPQLDEKKAKLEAEKAKALGKLKDVLNEAGENDTIFFSTHSVLSPGLLEVVKIKVGNRPIPITKFIESLPKTKARRVIFAACYLSQFGQELADQLGTRVYTDADGFQYIDIGIRGAKEIDPKGYELFEPRPSEYYTALKKIDELTRTMSNREVDNAKDKLKKAEDEKNKGDAQLAKWRAELAKRKNKTQQWEQETDSTKKEAILKELQNDYSNASEYWKQARDHYKEAIEKAETGMKMLQEPQEPLPKRTPPTLSEWGVITLVALFAASLAWMTRRKGLGNISA